MSTLKNVENLERIAKALEKTNSKLDKINETIWELIFAQGGREK